MNYEKQLSYECNLNIESLKLNDFILNKESYLKLKDFILNKESYLKLKFIKERMFIVLEYLKKKLITKSIYQSKNPNRIRTNENSCDYKDKKILNSIKKQEEYEEKKTNLLAYIKNLIIENKYYKDLLKTNED